MGSPKDFRRIAVVSRGEPAMRLIHAARELPDLSTIALYTDPDARAMFVREADVAVSLGPATFVDPRDPTDLARALNSVCDDPVLRRRLQHAAIHRTRRYRAAAMVEPRHAARMISADRSFSVS